MHGAILEAASLGPGVELGPLLARLDTWDLHQTTLAHELPARLERAEVVLCNKLRLGADAIACAPRLALIAVTATGTDNVDLVAAGARGIRVCNVRDYAEASVAEHTLMLMLALARSLGPYRAAVEEGEWSRSPFFCLHSHPVLELQGARLGVVGFGSLGRAVARLAAALGMDIRLARFPGRVAAPAPFPRVPLAELLAWAEVLTIHCPLTEQTRGLIGAAQLARMRPGALLINTARGGIVDEFALIEALRGGRLGGAAIDTLELEPPAPDAPLLRARLPNLIVTPHIAWASQAARQRLVDQVAEVIGSWRAGTARNVVL